MILPYGRIRHLRRLLYEQETKIVGTMNKEYVVATVLLGVIFAFCLVNLALGQPLSTGKWAMAAIASLAGLCIALSRTIGGRHR